MKRTIAGMMTGLVLGLSSCSTPFVGSDETQCSAAIARVSSTWEVRYYRDRVKTAPRNLRIEQFGRSELTTRNAEKPSGAATEAAQPGVWLPPPPPEPSAAELEAHRQFEETFEEPQLKHETQYRLQCATGELIANANIYQLASKDFRQGNSIRVNYLADRVLKADTASGEVLITDSAPRPATSASETKAKDTRPPASPNLQAILYVDPSQGDDRGNGSETQPLRTITQAIAQVRSGMTIQLRPGVYSAESGERFPLQLPAGIKLLGNPAEQGQGIQVSGGGKFLSPSWAGQSVTIVANQDCQVVGLTITNPNLRGTAIWIEAGSPLIEKNRFVGSDREGVFVSGNATPKISSNLFEQNGGNGLVFTRDSSGVAQDNVIRQQGFGIAIGDRATPNIFANEIRQNKDGMVINGSARPTLKSNQIVENGRDGIVVTNDAKPRLEANTFANNGNYDLHNATSDPLIVQRTNLATLKVEGPVN